MLLTLRARLLLEVYPELRGKTVRLMFPALLAFAAAAGVALVPVLTLPDEQTALQGVPPAPVAMDFGDEAGVLARWRTDGVVTISNGRQPVLAP